ncbi:MAG TPA: hypothetical protein VF230_16815 [Acidimicrobiales bacterium]
MAASAVLAVGATTVPSPAQAQTAPAAVTTLAELRAALAASDGKTPLTVTLAPGAIAIDGVPLAVKGDVTITGAGRGATTLDASAAARAIEATAGGKLRIEGLTIRGGVNPTSGGGAIKTSGVDLRLTDVLLVGGAAEADGGAVEVEGGSLTIERSELRENGAQHGGAVVAGGAAVTITDTRFEENGAAGNGGALLVSYPTSLAIRGTTFVGNTATRDGGAIHLEGMQRAADDELSIDAEFTGNYAGGEGGAVLVASTSDGLTEGLLAFDGSSFSDNVADAGGAIGVRDGRVRVADGDFTGNRASDDDGSGGGAIAAAGDLVVAGSAFDANESTANGGAISSTGRFRVEKSTFEANVSGGLGGALALVGSATPVVRATRFDANVAASRAGAVWRGGHGLENEDNTFDGNEPSSEDVVVDTPATAAVARSEPGAPSPAGGAAGGVPIAGVAAAAGALAIVLVVMSVMLARRRRAAA